MCIRDRVWALQGVPSDLPQSLTELAKKVQFEILHPPQGRTDVGEWTKKEDCWTRIRDLSISWDSTLAEYFVGNTALKQRAQESKKAGELDDSISVQKQVLDLVTSGYWLALYKWPTSRELFTPGEMNLLAKASTLNGFMKVALEKDWRKLLEIKNRASEEGFRTN